MTKRTIEVENPYGPEQLSIVVERDVHLGFGISVNRVKGFIGKESYGVISIVTTRSFKEEENIQTIKNNLLQKAKHEAPFKK